MIRMRDIQPCQIGLNLVREEVLQCQKQDREELVLEEAQLEVQQEAYRGQSHRTAVKLMDRRIWNKCQEIPKAGAALERKRLSKLNPQKPLKSETLNYLCMRRNLSCSLICQKRNVKMNILQNS